MNLLVNLFYFLVLVGVLVFVHEGGHFLFAKLFRVRVMVFSIGMGPRIFGFKKGGTDYRISAIPIGGYVRLLGEDPSEVNSEEERQQAVFAKPAWQRMIIYLAGPAMNLVFPFFLFFAMALGAQTLPPAEVGAVVPDSPAAAAGLESGDRIVEIDGERVYSYMHMVHLVRGRPDVPTNMVVERNGQRITTTIVPAATTLPRYPGMSLLSHLTDRVGRIGVLGIYPNPIVHVQPGSIGAKAGLKTFDRIDRVDGQPVATLAAIKRAFMTHRGQTVQLTISRRRTKLPTELLPAPGSAPSGTPVDQRLSMFEKKPRVISLSIPKKLDGLASLGLSDGFGTLLAVTPNGPAARAGLVAGDRLVGIDGRHADIYTILQRLVRSDGGKAAVSTHELMVERAGETMTVHYRADYISAGTKKDLGLADDTIDLGFHIQPASGEWSGIVPKEQPNFEKVGYALFMAKSQTLLFSRMIIDVLGSIFTGNISPKMFSGPLGIAHVTAQVSAEGPGAFLGFMGFLSLNLGLMNLLLPIPILDGGRLVLVAAEVVMRRKLSAIAQERMLVIGAVMILMLLLWAVIWDIARLVIA